MYINFRKLHIENFMSIGEVDIDFNSFKGFNMVKGINTNQYDNAESNGSGKSSIFESLIWALTGNTLRGNKDVVNHYTEEGTLVEVIFNVDNNEFKIIRTKDHSKYKNNLLIYVNNEDKSGKGIRDSEKILSEYLPELTTSLIGSVIILGQGLPNKFTSNSPSGRKEVLEKLFKADFMIEDMKSRIKSRLEEINNELRNTEDKILVINTKVDNYKETIENDAKFIAEISLKGDKESVEKDIKDIYIKIETLKTQANNSFEYINLQRDIFNKNNELIIKYQNEVDNKCKEVEDKYSEQLRDINDRINEANLQKVRLEVEIDRIKNIKDICPTCGQKLQNVEKPDTKSMEEELNQHEKCLYVFNEDKQNIENKILEEVTSIREAYIKIVNDATNIVDKGRIEIDEADKKLQEYRKYIEDLNLELKEKEILKNNIEFEIKNKEENIANNNKLIEACNKEKENLEVIHKDYLSRYSSVNSFNTIVNRDFRGYLIKDIVDLIEIIAKSYCKQVFGSDLIQFTIDGNNLYIAYNNKEYEALSGGERQKVDIIIQFAIRDALCKNSAFSSNILILDEIFDNLDNIGCQNIIDMITKRLTDIEDIFIVSHHSDELNIPYDNRIIVSKGNDEVSYINVI